MAVRLINVRDIAFKPLDDIWYLTEVTDIRLVMDDSEVEATGRSVLYSWFFWEFHRKIENLQFLKVHHVALKKMTANTHPEFLEQVMWSVYEMCKTRTKIITLKEIAYTITNELFNRLSINLEEYIISSSMLDYMEILEDPYIKELIENTPRNDAALIETKEKAKVYLKRDDILQQNGLKHNVEAELVNWGQALQGLIFRGFTTDMDNRFFPEAIMKGYAHGITKFHDSLIESSSSTKSLIAQESQLQHSEFFNKRMQLVSQIIRKLVPGDCGSTEFNTLRITEGAKSNFKSFLGKRYLKDDGSLGVISQSDTHLIGQRVQIRSVTNCAHRDKYKICHTCYGDLHLNVPEGCNLGYWSAVAFCEIISQMVLSTKHFDGAATIDMVYIDPMTEKVFDVLRKEQALVLKSVFARKDRRVTMVVSPVYNGDQSQLNYLEDLDLIDEIDNQTMMRKSNIHSFTITVENEEDGSLVLPPTTMTIGNGKDGAFLSKEMLYHIKANGWSVTEKGHYEFDLIDFDTSLPILALPKKHMNMSEFQGVVSMFMESRGNVKHKSKERLTEFNGCDRKVEQALNRFLEIVNEKVTVNLAHLELFILVFIAKDPAKNDCRIPKLSEPFTFICASDAFSKRSMGPNMPFKGQYDWLTKIESYDGSNKVGSTFDGMLKPEIFNDSDLE